ncbi:unnamed protein product [Ilex paraguariensis]|uniref:Uncharacterized protein n=1 Tax=Ilex paraguariensis TaxID=185542 RepID=A0ABC8SCJ2_9AQUA
MIQCLYRAKKDKIEAPTKDTAADMVAASLDCVGAGLGASAAIAALMEAAATTRAAHVIFFISMANEGGDRQINSRNERLITESCLCVCAALRREGWWWEGI